MSILIAGELNTLRQGLPTVSRELADSTPITGVFQGFATVYGAVRDMVTLLQLLRARSSHGTIVLLIGVGQLQSAALVLVGLFTLDYNVTAHYVVAGLYGTLSLLRAILFCIRRARNGVNPMVVCFNARFIFSQACFMVAFPVAAWMSDGTYAELHLPVLEYLVFEHTLFDPTWQFWDFVHDPPKLAED